MRRGRAPPGLAGRSVRRRAKERRTNLDHLLFPSIWRAIALALTILISAFAGAFTIMLSPSWKTGSRWMAIWLPRLPCDRLIRSGKVPDGIPLVVYAKTGNAYTITSLDRRASVA